MRPSMGGGVRPSRMWHWAVIAVLTATFLAEPRAVFGLAWDAFRATGQVGGALLTDDNPDVLGVEPGPEDKSEPPSRPPVSWPTLDDVPSVTPEQAITGVTGLHKIVDAALTTNAEAEAEQEG